MVPELLLPCILFSREDQKLLTKSRLWFRQQLPEVDSHTTSILLSPIEVKLLYALCDVNPVKMYLLRVDNVLSLILRIKGGHKLNTRRQTQQRENKDDDYEGDGGWVVKGWSYLYSFPYKTLRNPAQLPSILSRGFVNMFLRRTEKEDVASVLPLNRKQCLTLRVLSTPGNLLSSCSSWTWRERTIEVQQLESILSHDSLVDLQSVCFSFREILPWFLPSCLSYDSCASRSLCTVRCEYLFLLSLPFFVRRRRIRLLYEYSLCFHLLHLLQFFPHLPSWILSLFLLFVPMFAWRGEWEGRVEASCRGSK